MFLIGYLFVVGHTLCIIEYLTSPAHYLIALPGPRYQEHLTKMTTKNISINFHTFLKDNLMPSC